MILFENGLITLDYDDSQSVLMASCPDLQEFVLLQIHASFSAIVDTIAQRGITNLLLDCSNTRIEVSDEDYRMVISHFIQELMATKLQRFARVATEDLIREDCLQKHIPKILQELRPMIAINSFSSRAEAMSWLLDGKAP